MPELLTPGVYFEETKPAPGIGFLRTDIAFFAGIAERGPVGAPVRVAQWEQFRAQFGEFQRNAFLAYAIKGFFENGGDVCWVTRVAAPARTTNTSGPQPTDRRSSNVANAAGLVAGAVATLSQTRQTQTVGPQPADRLQSFVVAADGFPPHVLVEFRQGALRSFRTIKARDFATNRLAWDRAIDAAFNLALPVTLVVTHRTQQRVLRTTGTTVSWEGVIGPEYSLATPIEVATGATTSEATLYDATSHPTLRIQAIEPGSWGDRITVHVGRSSRFAAVTSHEPQPAGSVGLKLESVTGFRASQLVGIFQPGAPAPEFRVLDRVEVARQTITWTGALPAAFSLPDAASGARPISVESLEFLLSVSLDGRLAELHDGLSLIASDKDYYVEKAVARTSRLITAQVLPSPAAIQDRLPDPRASNLTGAATRLFGGRDGVAAISTVEFLSALDGAADLDEVAILAIPDLMIRPVPLVTAAPLPVVPPDPCLLGPALPPDAPPPQPILPEQAPSLSVDQISRVQQAMLTQCELKMDRFAILDPPPPPATGSFGQVQSWRLRFESKFGALYHPWILTPDPLRVENRPVRRVPPSGAVVGCYAANDLELGVHHAPANRLVKFAQGAAEEVSDGQQDVLNPAGINCLREFPGRGLRVWGARTVSRDPEWRFVNVRRLMSFVEEALEEGLQWAVFRPNGFQLRSLITASVTVFLERLWEQGALVGARAEEAYFVRCDAENNPDSETARGKLLIEVGVALVRPAEFVVIRIGRIDESFEIEERQGRGYGNR
jgi:uncharacterized protein